MTLPSLKWTKRNKKTKDETKNVSSENIFFNVMSNITTRWRHQASSVVDHRTREGAKAADLKKTHEAASSSAGNMWVENVG